MYMIKTALILLFLLVLKTRLLALRKSFKKYDVKNSEVPEHLLSWNKCNYKAKKEANLKKHMITQHDDHAGKGCKEKLPSFMDLMKHVAKPHAKETFEEQTGVEDIQEEHTKGEQKKRGRLKLWNALNPKFGGLGSWNFTNLFLRSDKQVVEVSAS